MKKAVVDNRFVFALVVLANLVASSVNNSTLTEREEEWVEPESFIVTPRTLPPPPPPPINRRCQPLPNDVLWKRINPSGPTGDYDDDFLPRSPRSISGGGGGGGSQSGGSRSQAREWHTGNADRTTSKPTTRGARRFRKKDLYVALLGQQHPGNLSSDVYRSVRHGVAEEEENGVASSRRKRKLGKHHHAERQHQQQQQQQQQQQRPSPVGSPWHCRLEKKWKKMRDGIFPRQVQTGKCAAKTCMMSMYECRPRKYAVRVLRRLDGHCNPLPLSGPNTTYEEVWAMDHYRVTVACECSRPKASGTYGPTT